VALKVCEMASSTRSLPFPALTSSAALMGTRSLPVHGTDLITRVD
jgi:hypothetical protein